MFPLLSVLSGILVGQAPADPNESRLADVLRANTYTITVVDGGLTGSGGEFIRKATADAQFVCVAEPHNVREVPESFSALFRLLHEAHGYNYAALETGPAIMERASSPPVRGDFEALKELFGKFPESFHFYTDQELAVMAEIGTFSTAATPPLWGVDQVHAVPFAAWRLMELAPNDEARNRSALLHANAELTNNTRGLRGDTYMFVHEGDFLDIAEWFGDDLSEEAAFLIDQLALSQRVYRNIRSANEVPGNGYRSNCEREDNMKTLFMKRYREAQAAGDALPRVLARLGHWHLMRGMSPGGCYTLGNFLSEFAKSNGMTTFQIAVTVLNEPGKYWSISESEGFEALAAAGSTSEWRIIDLRPLRPLAHAGALPGLSRELRDWAFRYDAALVLGGAERGTYRIDIERKRELRRRQRDQ